MSDMKLKIVSDQHLEFLDSGSARAKYFRTVHPEHGERADVCVVAGDFVVFGPDVRGLFSELCDRESQILFVPGNHEYYGCRSMSEVDDGLSEIERCCPI